MGARSLIVMLCLVLGLPSAAAARPAGPPLAAHPAKVRDLAQIQSSRVLRVLVNQSRNSSGQVRGQAIGVEYHRLQAFQNFLNAHAGKGQALQLKIIPRAKEQLLGALQRGEGDLVAPGELMELHPASKVAASDAVIANVPFVLVSGKGGRRPVRVEQLAGKTLALPNGSAAGAAIERLNQKLALRKLAPIDIEWVDPSLAVEDVLEMVQAGIYPLTVVELPIAERWAKVMPRLRVDRRVVLSAPGSVSWYVRRDAPQLGASVDRFLASYKAPSDQDAAFVKVYRGLYKVHYPLARSDR